MYPEIVINYNISTETVQCSCCQDEPAAREQAITGDPEVDAKGYWICVKQKGLFPQFMEGLKAKRKEFKEQKADAEKRKDWEAYEQYEIAQLAIKLYMNASYGCFGYSSFRYRDKRVASLITASGRKFATGAKELAESDKYKFVCIYGDTDGLLLKSRDENDDPNQQQERLEQLLQECHARFKLPIENDRNFIEVTPIEKKQYLGIDAKNGKVVVKGLEAKKHDACRFNARQFAKFISNYENGLDPIPDIAQGLETLRKGHVTAKDLGITVKVNQVSYEDNSAMGKIVAASGAQKGDMITYYLTSRKGDAWSLNPADASISKYMREHLTDLGKVLYAMGYDVDALYGPDINASAELLKRREKNDKGNKRRKQK
jgi:DNA polymerase, archaea type